MSNDRYFQDAALTLLGILTCNRKNPVNQKTRELSFGEMGLLHCLEELLWKNGFYAQLYNSQFDTVA